MQDLHGYDDLLVLMWTLLPRFERLKYVSFVSFFFLWGLCVCVWTQIVLNEESPLLSQIANDIEEKPPESPSETSRGSTESLEDRTREFSLSISLHDASDDEDHSSIVPVLKDKSSYMMDKEHISRISSPGNCRRPDRLF